MSLSRFILPTIALILGLVLGFFANELILPAPLITQETTQKPQIKSVTEEDLPVSLELLQNPITYEWRGSVRGNLVAKNEDAIFLRDDEGNEITIPLKISPGPHMMTDFHFVPKDRSTGPSDEISLDEIPLGAYLIGDFFTVPGGDKSKIVGGSFGYFEERPR